MGVSKAVLITGCSSGIGRATAERLLARPELTVYATARRTGALADLAAAGAHTLALDVTDEASMAAAVAHVEAAHGAVGALVNNAGYGAYGAIEDVPLDRVEAQFDTNVLGIVRTVQAVLPKFVVIRPGSMIATCTPNGATSTRSASDRASTACFEAW